MPTVTLSPKARNLVLASVGRRDTRTWNPHDPLWPRLSAAVQRTSVSPIGNGCPEGGVQETATGAVPPCAGGVS
jgi:hypothetical protein